MSHDMGGPDPGHIDSLPGLARALTALRRRGARAGQVQLSVRDVATRTGCAPSTLHPYLRGERLCPADVYERMLRALGVEDHRLRPWLDAWERVADGLVRDRAGATPSAPAADGSATAPGRPAAAPDRPSRRQPDLVEHGAPLRYRIRGAAARATVGIVTGDLRRVRSVDVWVNSENTGMQMSRFEDHSVSAIIRFEGAVLDPAGRVVDDRVATELARRLAGRVPVAPGTAVTTGAGELRRRNNVRYVIHVAAVQGEPGNGYRQIRDVGRCVTNALAQAEALGAQDAAVRTILFPILGVGGAGGALEPTVRALLDAAVDHVSNWPRSRLAGVFLLASTAEELVVCREVFDRRPGLTRVRAARG